MIFYYKESKSKNLFFGWGRRDLELVNFFYFFYKESKSLYIYNFFFFGGGGEGGGGERGGARVSDFLSRLHGGK